MTDRPKSSRIAIEAVRWLLMPICAVILVKGTVKLTNFLWRNGLDRSWVEAFAAFTAGFLVFAAFGLMAPRWKIKGSICGLLAGAVLFYQVVPWFDSVTQQPTIRAYATGITGMISGFALTCLWVWWRNRSDDPNS